MQHTATHEYERNEIWTWLIRARDTNYLWCEHHTDMYVMRTSNCVIAWAHYPTFSRAIALMHMCDVTHSCVSHWWVWVAVSAETSMSKWDIDELITLQLMDMSCSVYWATCCNSWICVAVSAETYEYEWNETWTWLIRAHETNYLWCEHHTDMYVMRTSNCVIAWAPCPTFSRAITLMHMWTWLIQMCHVNINYIHQHVSRTQHMCTWHILHQKCSGMGWLQLVGSLKL